MNLFRRDYKFALLSVFLLTLIFSLGDTALAQNGSLYFSPSSGTVSVGQSFSMVVRVNTGGTAINATEGSIIFDAAKLSVSSVSKVGSIFTIWASEPSFSNAEGTIDFGGGVPNPGYSGSNGLVLTINFRAKTSTSISGSTDISLVSGGILANDGLGTNILASLGRASYIILPGVIQPTPPPSQLEAPATGGVEMSILSSTHPDQSKWYSNKNPVFKWSLPKGVSEVNLVLSRRANSPPIISYSPPIAEKVLEDLEDGAWYLNGRFRTSAGLGPIDSFGFNIDTVPPSNFSITRLDSDDPTNPRPELLFESSDTTSGIDRYEMKIGEGDWFIISSDLAGKPYKLPFQSSDTREVLVKAIDKAGNYTSSNVKVLTKPVLISPPIIKDVIFPNIETDRVAVIKKEVEVVVKEVVVKEVVVKEVVVKEVVVKEVVVKGLIAKKIAVTENVALKTAAVVVDVFKLKNSNSFGQIQESINDAKKELVKTVEVPVDENGNFEAKINDLETGTYILRTYGKDERGAISDAFSDVILKITGGEGLLDAIWQLFDKIINFLSGRWLLIAFGTAVAGFVIVLIELVKTRAGWWLKKINNFLALRRIKVKSVKKLDHIIEDMREEIKFLMEISKRRPHSVEEKYLKAKLNQYIKILKNSNKE